MRNSTDANESLDYAHGYNVGFKDGLAEARRIVFGYFDKIDKERADEAERLAKRKVTPGL